jgi:hypothetical protein
MLSFIDPTYNSYLLASLYFVLSIIQFSFSLCHMCSDATPIPSLLQYDGRQSVQEIIKHNNNHKKTHNNLKLRGTVY